MKEELNGAVIGLQRKQANSLSSIDTNIGSTETHISNIDTNIGLVETHIGTIDTNVAALATSTAARDTAVSSLVTAQDLTGSYADAGAEINVTDYNRLGLYVICDTNDSRSITLQVLGMHTSGGTEYTIDGSSVKTVIDAVTATDLNIYYEFDVGTIPYVQVQIKAGTVGATAGDITIHVDKKWRN